MTKQFVNGVSCKAVKGQFGEFFNISLNLEKLTQYQNEKGYVNLTMSKRKEVGQYGETHSFTLNEWKPSDSQVINAVNMKPISELTYDEIFIDSLPF